MMTPHTIEPGTGFAPSAMIQPGAPIELQAGAHDKPLFFTGLRGTKDAPIVITQAKGGGATISGPMDEKTARRFLNQEAQRRAAGGYYPAVGHLGDLAAITLRDCQFVLIDGLMFEDCWPTAIYIDDCRFVGVRGCRIEGATIAIGINGSDTRHVLIEENFFQQDMSENHDLWNTIPWSDVHGAVLNGGAPVDVNNDMRHLDGDFVRAWDIAGDLVVRGNEVSDAFNGIHLFNRIDQIAPGVVAHEGIYNEYRSACANVLIEKNHFTRVRDNVFEPEQHAWNWVIRHNTWFDCAIPFSLELHRAGWLYIYGNTGISENKPSPGGERSSFAVFKSGRLQRNEGPIYVLFNSFKLPAGQRYFRRGGFGFLRHYNNVVDFGKSRGRFFGSTGAVASPVFTDATNSGVGGSVGGGSEESWLKAQRMAEQNRFTRRWGDGRLEAGFNIEMDGDTVNDTNYPQSYAAVGYPLGDASVGAGEPEQKSIAVALLMPDGSTVPLPAEFDRGAKQSTAQGQAAMAQFDQVFTFIPDFAWADAVAYEPKPKGSKAMV